MENNSSGWDVSVTVSRVGLCWDYNHNISNSFNGNTKYTDSEVRLGWDFYNVSQPFDDDIGLARYRVTTVVDGNSGDSFYIDYTTADLPASYSASADIDVYLNCADRNFYWDDNFTQSVGSSYTIWGLNATIENIKRGLEPYVPDNFDVNENNFNPQLTWNHSSEADYITGYEIYRGVNSPFIMSKIADLGIGFTSYLDTEYDTQGSETLYYKIRAKNGTKTSDFTNTESATGGLYKNSFFEGELTYNLMQNFPNPFNPTTTIKFSIPSDQNVTLKVYNSVGEEVVSLVNEFLTAGYHSFTFDGDNLTSGIYFYIVKAGSFTDTKKLLLVK